GVRAGVADAEEHQAGRQLVPAEVAAGQGTRQVEDRRLPRPSGQAVARGEVDEVDAVARGGVRRAGAGLDALLAGAGGRDGDDDGAGRGEVGAGERTGLTDDLGKLGEAELAQGGQRSGGGDGAEGLAELACLRGRELDDEATATLEGNAHDDAA